MSRAEHIAFVCPRFAEGPTVGGGETLIRALAARAAASGREVSFLTTCARDHFTWNNELPAGTRQVGDLSVSFFPVDEDRDVASFMQIQESICRGRDVSDNDAMTWLKNSVNSRRLYDHLQERKDYYDRVVAGPYLWGLTYFASLIHPEKSVLLPCLHDEPFAYLKPIEFWHPDVEY